jgi:hypothetical protein
VKFAFLFILLPLISFNTLALAQIPNYVPQNGLVGWWPFNGNANDESGNGNNGAVNGAALTTDRFGSSNKAYYFSSTNCNPRIDISNFNYGGVVNSFSISFWIKRVGNGCISPRLFEFGNGSGWGVNWINNAPNMDWIANSILSDNVWYHIVYVIQTGSIKSYVNGNFDSQFQISWSVPNSFFSNVCFGRMNHPSFDAFNGSLDDISVFRRALQICEIQSLYQSQIVIGSATITPQSQTTFCQGDSVVLTANQGASYLWSNGQTTQSITATSSGAYSVQVTDTNGCVANAQPTQVTVNPPPQVSISNNGPTTFCQGDSVILQASGATN